MKKLFLILAACFVVYSTHLNAQAKAISFKKLSSDFGLSQSVVHALDSDYDGIVWAGTQNGLNQFDGYQFSSFYNEKTDTNSLGNNYIWEIAHDSLYNIWIGTNGGGLCKYNTIQKQFTSYPVVDSSLLSPTQNSVRTLHVLSSKQLLIGTDNGLYLFDTKRETFEKLNQTKPGKILSNSIFSFEPLDDRLVLVGSLESIFVYDIFSKELRAVPLSYPISGGIHSLCFSSRDGTIWAGTGKGLLELEWHTDSMRILRQYLPGDKMPKPIASSYISDLLIDANNGLWLATNGGLSYLNLSDTQNGFVNFTNDPKNSKSISSNLVYDLLEVESDIIWAATQEGINQFIVKAPLFGSLALSDERSSAGCGKSIHGMSVDQEKLLACTDKGLILMDIPSENNHVLSIDCYDKNNLPDLEDEFLVSISSGSNGRHWVALRRGGFAAAKLSNDQVEWTSYKLPAGDYSNIGTNDFVEDSDGQLWIASSGLGLWKLNLSNGTYKSFAKSPTDSVSISGNYIFYLMEDKVGHLWVATADGGLCQMNKKTESFECFTHDVKDPYSISSNMVLSVFEDSKGRVWACTVDGLNLLNDDGQFQRFYKKDGLPDNLVYGMLEDDQQQLWISTDQGIAKLLYENGELSCKSYKKENGLIRNEFNQHAFQQLADGRLVFGTNGGLNFFDPKDLPAYEVLPYIKITDFKLFNESVPVVSKNQAESFNLTKHINHTTEITLPYHQNFLAFEFTGINFDQIQANQYAYQMDGLDEDWVYGGTRRFANYPDMKPGEYVFKVKASNHDGKWTDTPKILRITIKKPPWKTWWAYLLYAISGFAIIYSIFQYRLYTYRKIEQTRQNERLLFRKRSARDFHDEAGNQITKISLMTEVAKRKSDTKAEVNTLLDQIGEEVQSLRDGMRDFIWVLDPGSDNLYETLLRLKEFANGIFEYSDIHFSTKGIDEAQKKNELDGNRRRHLLLIFKEAINNTLKYSLAENAILTIKSNSQHLLISFKDDGKGFDLNQNSQGQGLKNIRQRADKINAKCTINTAPNKGTEIILSFDITQMGD